MSLHQNNGQCTYCQKIFDRYAGFYEPLRTWFEGFQATHPEAHISCAGRGRQDQEECFMRKASHAHYGQSAHNKNCAVDIFIDAFGRDMYDPHWFATVLWPNLPPWADWYGTPNAPFKELPHVELRKWQDVSGLKLVEE